MTCWSLPKPVAYIALGRYGDIIQLLPAFLALYERSGQRPVVAVAREFADVLEGVSYVKAWPLDVDWASGGSEARRLMEEAGFQAICPIWWNDSPEAWQADVRTTGGSHRRQIRGRSWMIDDAHWPDYGSSMWDILGFTQAEMETFRLVFDKRDAGRERALVESVTRGGKPVLLYNFVGKASPFPATPEVVNRLLQCGNRFKLVDLGKIQATRIYDLLGLYDMAAGLITSDTATLHLAPASRIPYVAFTQDGWLGSRPKGNWKQNIKYLRALVSADEVIQIASGWSVVTPAARTVTLRRTAAVGDVVAATSVARQLKALGFRVVFQSFNMIHMVLRRSPFVDAVAEPVGHCDIDLDGAYEKHPKRTALSFPEIYLETANKQALSKMGAPLSLRNCAPILSVDESEKDMVRAQFQSQPHPWVVIGPRSNSFANRTIPDATWAALAPLVKGTCFWSGSHAAAPAGMIDLVCRDLDHLTRCLSLADQFVGVDSGPMHIAAALGIPVLAVEQASAPALHLTDQRDFEGVRMPGLTCLNCQQNLCPIGDRTHPPCTNIPLDWLVGQINRKLRAFQPTVSAIIPIYKPTEERLNKVIAHVIKQVDEIVITAEEGVEIPRIHDTSGKVRVVIKGERKLGYGRNTNYGARHSFGRFLLLLNDDVFLDEKAVGHMLAEMEQADVGAVAHFLSYPDGTIYHAGKVRAPGVRGWGHIDHRKYIPTIQTSCDMENVCGASLLVRRSAFYDIGGFDEDFFVYAEDDDFNLRLRRNNWRIRYTPHARGIHMEHQSTQSLGNIHDVVNQANGLFGKKWGAYFDHNLHRVPGNFDYLH